MPYFVRIQNNVACEYHSYIKPAFMPAGDTLQPVL